MRGRYKGAAYTPRGGPHTNRTFSSRPSSRPFQHTKKCFVCGKISCWSTNHTQQERDDSKKKFGDRYPEYKTRPGYERNLQRWITEYEGVDDDEGIAQYFGNLSIDTHDDYTTESTPESFYTESEQFHTSIGQLQGSESVTVVNTLADNAFKHRITLSDETASPISSAPYVFNSSTDSRYNDTEFKGLLIDSGASTRSTGGIGQLKALQQLDPSVQLDKNTAGSANFTFGIGSAGSIGSVDLDTPLGLITFYIVLVNTPFLLRLTDMDKHGAFFNNITNQVIKSKTQPARSHPVIRRYGHAFLLWYTSAYTLATESLALNPCYLTDVELRRLHRRFGHPSVHHLHQLLERSGNVVELQALQYLTKYCEQYQKHGRSPGRFTFTLKEDLDFNYNVIVDIIYIEGKPVLYLVDEATRFQAGRWLKNISAQHVWDQLRLCWIATYLGPPDLVTADAGKQFMAREFKQYPANMGIIF